MIRLKGILAALVAGGSILTLAGSANGQAIVTNGTVRLGIRDLGHLNLEDGPPSVLGNTTVGVRYINPGVGEFEYTSPGCLCEGWGVADVGSGVTGFANVAAGTGGLLPVSFTNDVPGVAATAKVMTIPAPAVPILEVTQSYSPSVSPNLYVDQVTIRNIGVVPATDVRYVRVMDWDVEPTTFDEFVTIGGLPAANLVRSHNNGFSSADPLAVNVPLLGSTLNTNFTHLGPADHGAYFQFSFGALLPSVADPAAAITFQIFYGGASSVSAALAALGAVGAEVYSLGEPNLPTGDPGYTVSIFGFKGVGGTPLPPGPIVPEPGAMAMLAGMGIAGLGFFLRRRPR